MNSDDLLSIILQEFRSLRDDHREDNNKLEQKFQEMVDNLKNDFKTQIDCVNTTLTNEITIIKKDISSFKTFKTGISAVFSFILLLLTLLSKIFSVTILKWFHW